MKQFSHLVVGDHIADLPKAVEQTAFSNHASWVEINPQPLPPMPDPTTTSSDDHMSWAMINPQPLPPMPDPTTGGDDHMSWVMLNPQPLPPGPPDSTLQDNFNHVAVSFEVPAISTGDFAHQMHI